MYIFWHDPNMGSRQLSEEKNYCFIGERLHISTSFPLVLAFITLKGHKENFVNKPTCRLINPTKTELDKISKKIIQDINKQLVEKLKVNQWKSTKYVTDWFKKIDNKKDCKFIQFDIKQFYPAISESILGKAINFAKEFIDIESSNLRTIQHCRKSLLFHMNEAWKKKSTDSCFDVTMGSYDGAEICELVGIFILKSLEDKIDKQDIGLYRDDGLMILRNANGQKTDRTRKYIIKVMKGLGFQIEIETNLKEVNFLDVTFNLNSGLYKPYKKPNDQLLYVTTSSDHPPQVIKQLPNSINRKLMEN